MGLTGAVVVLVIVVAMLMSAIPMFLLAKPNTVVRMQVQATARDADRRAPVGRWFQRRFRIDPDHEPWADRAWRRVRLLGVLELVVIWCLAALVVTTLG